MCTIIAKCFTSYTEFAEIPSNVTVELGTPPPTLRCRHTSPEAIITWLVNRSSVGQFSDISFGFVNENGNIVYTLTIPVELQYNGTVVECLALFINGPLTERTPEAIIIFTATSPIVAPGSAPSIIIYL